MIGRRHGAAIATKEPLFRIDNVTYNGWTMPAFYCSICGGPVVEGGSLCAEHHSQAARFSVTFGNNSDSHEGPHDEVDPSTELRARVRMGLDEIVAWASSPRAETHQWPQLALYYLRGEMLHRRFYGVVPGGPLDETSFPLTKAVLEPAFDTDSPVFKELEALLEARRGPLSRGEIQMLCIDIKPHDNMITLGEVRGDKTRAIHKSFVYFDNAFVPA